MAQQTGSVISPVLTEIITPISITNNASLNFGVFSTNGASGTIALSSAAVVTASTGIKVTKKTTPTTAAFTVTGEANYAYTIGVPTTITLKGLTVANTMTITDFKSSLTTYADGLIGSGGTQVINLGGTLNVPVSAKKDTYSNSADLIVTVNYN
jgi:hypothetical protein